MLGHLLLLSKKSEEKYASKFFRITQKLPVFSISTLVYALLALQYSFWHSRYVFIALAIYFYLASTRYCLNTIVSIFALTCRATLRYILYAYLILCYLHSFILLYSVLGDCLSHIKIRDRGHPICDTCITPSDMDTDNMEEQQEPS